MAVNIEIKARVRDAGRLRGRAEQLCDTPGEAIRQEDTFFHSPQGRLKLRVLAPDRGQLVYYEREDTSGPRASHYVILETPAPESLKGLLSAALGTRGTVRKERLLYRVGSTRIHLDEVEGLGTFVELEVVLGPGDSAEEGEAVAAEMMERLGIEQDDLVRVAYIDLLEGRTG